MGQQDRWFTCSKCGLLGVTPNRHFSLFRHHCKWCDLSPRWLTDEEATALMQHPTAVGAVRAGRNVSMSHEGGQCLFAEWGARSKPPTRPHVRRRGSEQ
jgi:hypothetical protein